jgi:hypothetical protein
MGAFTRFAGGRAHGDCAVVTDVAGAAAAHPAVGMCTDGDPTCDHDAAADGTCTFSLRLCFGAPLPSCPADAVVHAGLVRAAAVLAPLADAITTVAMPVAGGTDVCTNAVDVPVAVRRRLVLRAAASMASGGDDRDRLVLTCRRPRPPVGFAVVQREVFARSCTSFSCHGAATAGGLDLSPDGAYASLVGVAPANPAASAAGLLRVAPGDPDRSFLLHKLAGTLEAGEGDRMPRVGISLPASRIDLVRRWISAGAPPP